ncbi:MAG: hypothetical protein WEB89_05420 [Balneolales bacterium]
MSIASTSHLGHKTWKFKLRFQVNYYVYKLLSSLHNHLAKVNEYLKGVLTRRVDDLTELMMDVYAESENITPDQAKRLHPDIIRIRKMLYKQDNKLSEIDYYMDVRQQLRHLIRITNRAEARIHTAIYKESTPVKTPEYLRKGLLSQDKKIITNALREKADH